MKPVLQTVWHTCGAHKLIVLLPGAYMKPDDFRAAGFFAAAARRRAPDIVAVDLDPGLISDGSALSLLDAEVIAPARRQGHAAIWLGGVSLGGLLALCYNADTPAGVDGLCLLAPYPGSRLTRNAITRAGGLEAWEPDCQQLDDPEFRMWRWLKRPPVAFCRAGDLLQGSPIGVSRILSPFRRSAVSGGALYKIEVRQVGQTYEARAFSAAAVSSCVSTTRRAAARPRASSRSSCAPSP